MQIASRLLFISIKNFESFHKNKKKRKKMLRNFSKLNFEIVRNFY